jgi:hypothetical protein
MFGGVENGFCYVLSRLVRGPCLHTSASRFLVLRVSVQNAGHVALLPEERTHVVCQSFHADGRIVLRLGRHRILRDPW